MATAQVSASEASAVSPATSNGPEVIKIEKTYKFIDLATMTEQEKKVKVEFVPASTVEEAMARLTDDDQRLNALNAQLKRITLFEARKESIEGGAPRGVILKMAVPFRMLPPFSGMLVPGPNGKTTVESKRLQTKAILEAFAANPMIIEMLRAKVAEMSVADEDDDDAPEE